MSVLDPSLAILDETDSGLDIDALRNLSQGINNFMTPDKSLILITHYQRLLDYIKPDFIHIMHKGKIIKTGDASLALILEGQAVSQRLQPTQSSVRGADAIWPARHPSQGTISRTSVGQARTHCVQPIHVS